MKTRMWHPVNGRHPLCYDVGLRFAPFPNSGDNLVGVYFDKSSIEGDSFGFTVRELRHLISMIESNGTTP